MKNAYVYSLICPISNKIKYIGQTRQKLYKRLYKHLREINKNKSHKNNWLKILEKQNILHKLRIEIIEECAFDKLNEREIYWIKFYKNKGLNLTNMTTGGECGSLGYKHTDEAKRKIAERNKLPKHETSLQGRENISKSLIGNKRRLGKKHSNETKDKISKSKIGSIPCNRRVVYQYDKELNLIEIYQSVKEAAEILSTSAGNISGVANGKRKYCKKFKWSYERLDKNS